jgi:hypothetical protein
MTVQYESNIIRAHAEALYDQARGIVFMSGLIGFILGGIGGAMLDGAMNGGPMGKIVLALLVMYIGIRHGRGRAFVLQLQAQTALCQVAIEANTRRAADAVAASHPPAVAQLTQVG